jgi:hypothetical protein
MFVEYAKDLAPKSPKLGLSFLLSDGIYHGQKKHGMRSRIGQWDVESGVGRLAVL